MARFSTVRATGATDVAAAVAALRAEMLTAGGLPLRLAPTPHIGVAGATVVDPLVLPGSFVLVDLHKYRVSGVLFARRLSDNAAIFDGAVRDAAFIYASGALTQRRAGDLVLNVSGGLFATFFAFSVDAPSLVVSGGALAISSKTIALSADIEVEFDGVISDAGTD